MLKGKIKKMNGPETYVDTLQLYLFVYLSIHVCSLTWASQSTQKPGCKRVKYNANKNEINKMKTLAYTHIHTYTDSAYTFTNTHTYMLSFSLSLFFFTFFC